MPACLCSALSVLVTHSLTRTPLPRGAQEFQTSMFRFASSVVFAVRSHLLSRIECFSLNIMLVSERRSRSRLMRVGAHLSVFVRV